MPTNGMITVTDHARPATFTVEAVDEHGNSVPTAIAGEHPLTLYLDRRELVTLMTLGAAPEHLAIGYLRNQRIIASPDEIASVQVDWETSAAAITSRSLAQTGQSFWEQHDRGSALQDRLDRRTVTTGCGQGTMFGDLLEDIAALRLPATPRLTEETLYGILDSVRRQTSVYKVAGAVHACALCFNTGPRRGEILWFIEDVGRHNAVDAIAGRMWTDAVDGGEMVFYTTGRLTSEMVIKCAQMGIPFLLSRSGLTQMGHAIAERVGLTMIGRCQGRHYLLFTGATRFVRSPSSAIA